MVELSIWHWILLLVGGLLYFLPGIVASLRCHQNRIAIWVLDLILGWTGVGWIVVMIWALTAVSPRA